MLFYRKKREITTPFTIRIIIGFLQNCASTLSSLLYTLVFSVVLLINQTRIIYKMLHYLYINFSRILRFTIQTLALILKTQLLFYIFQIFFNFKGAFDVSYRLVFSPINRSNFVYFYFTLQIKNTIFEMYCVCSFLCPN